jgi:hypothetical protein
MRTLQKWGGIDSLRFVTTLSPPGTVRAARLLKCEHMSVRYRIPPRAQCPQADRPSNSRSFCARLPQGQTTLTTRRRSGTCLHDPNHRRDAALAIVEPDGRSLGVGADLAGRPQSGHLLHGAMNRSPLPVRTGCCRWCHASAATSRRPISRGHPSAPPPFRFAPSPHNRSSSSALWRRNHGRER